IVGIAPLLGLVGTIFGMMTLFSNIGEQGLGDANKLASGIAVILVTTLWGLIIAIPSLVFWSYYNKKVETIAVEMETLCDEFIRRQYREEAAAKALCSMIAILPQRHVAQISNLLSPRYCRRINSSHSVS